MGFVPAKAWSWQRPHEEASTAAREMLSGDAFGDAGRTVVLEERLYGSEVSAHAICDGTRAWVLPIVQDHKRLGENDTGPNTGVMGTYGPVALPRPELAAYIQTSIVDKVMAGMSAVGSPFRGTLFANVMLPHDGDPALIEINVRLGDPETQVLTNLLEGDLCELLMRAARGDLGTAPELSISERKHALCVILAAPGYPAAPRLGGPIRARRGSGDGGCSRLSRRYGAGVWRASDGRGPRPGSDRHRLGFGRGAWPCLSRCGCHPVCRQAGSARHRARGLGRVTRCRPRAQRAGERSKVKGHGHAKMKELPGFQTSPRRARAKRACPGSVSGVPSRGLVPRCANAAACHVEAARY